MNRLDISIIVCTYNRADSLRQTLEACCALVVPPGLTWELIVVNNNCTDHTEAVCRAFTERLPFVYLFQPIPGKTSAQKMALQQARGDLYLFTDDDVSPEKLWLASYWAAIQAHPDCPVFGGKVLPQWSSPPPQWVLDHSHTSLTGVTVHYDEGDQDHFFKENDSLPFGANMAFRREIFDSGGYFREDLGPRPSEFIMYEETEFIRSLILSGKKALYVASAVVNHRNSPVRMTEAYVRKWYRGSGVGLVRLGYVKASGPMLFGAPLIRWWKAFRHGTEYVLLRYIRPPKVWLRSEINMAQTWGMIIEFRRQSRRKSPGSS